MPLNPTVYQKRRIERVRVLPPAHPGNNGRYMFILNVAAELVYIYDLNTAWPFTLAATIDCSSMNGVGGIAYRPQNDSIYVLGALDLGIIANASNPVSASLTRITSGITLNFTSNSGGWSYDYRNDYLYNIDGNGGGLKILDPKTNQEVAPKGIITGLGAGSSYFAGDIEKIVICNSGYFGIIDASKDEQKVVFGRLGSGSLLGCRDAVFYNGYLYALGLSAVQKFQQTVTGELSFIGSISTTQLTRTMCADRLNDKLIVVCNNDGGAQNFNFKFIDPGGFSINSTPTEAPVSDERGMNAVKFADFDGMCYCVSRNVTDANSTRLFQIDGATEAVINIATLPDNLSATMINNNMMCFNRIEL